MDAVRLFLSPSGRLSQRPFIPGAIAVYIAGAVSQLLTSPSVLSRIGLWPFAIVQALLIWAWSSLHAKRLRDAGDPVGFALAASLLYALAVVLLFIVASAFIGGSSTTANDPNATTALGLALLLLIISTLGGWPQYDLTWVVVAILTAAAFVPVIVAFGVTLWAALRPTAPAAKPVAQQG